jgi:membrane-bound serine protease (ClpP class)
MGLEVYLVLLIGGLLLLGAEIYIPGGIVGAIGGLFLLASIIMSFQVFSTTVALYATTATVFLVGVSMVLWIKVFPRTSMGRKLMVTNDESTFKASPDGLADLLGKEGISVCDLRPSGFVRFGTQRVDVVADGMMISKDTPVRVVKVEGFRVVVKPVVSQV